MVCPAHLFAVHNCSPSCLSTFIARGKEHRGWILSPISMYKYKNKTHMYLNWFVNHSDMHASIYCKQCVHLFIIHIPFIIFDVHLLAGKRTTSDVSSLALGVVRAWKASAVVSVACATACLAMCSAATADYIRECLGRNWRCWDSWCDGESFDVPAKVNNI